jgi:excinuclease ABC subunit A
LRAVSRNNLHRLDCDIPLGVLTTVTGVSGSGKSSLVSQALVELVTAALGQDVSEAETEADPLEREEAISTSGMIEGGVGGLKRLVQVDQKPIGRTPRSNLATYTGLFDHIRKLFAATTMAKRRRYDAGQFSFNVPKGRCSNCNGEGSVMVELLFLPSVYAPCPVCRGTRYNDKTLGIRYRDKTIADVLALTVDDAWSLFELESNLAHGLGVLREVGVGYLRLGQSATELSGGEAQRIKLATELQRIQKGDTLYVLDEPTTGLHPADVEKLIAQAERLVEAGNTVVVIEHEMRVAAVSDWVIDVGPGAGEEGGRLVSCGPPQKVAGDLGSRTAGYLSRFLLDGPP